MPRSGFDRLAYREPEPSAAIMRALGWFNAGVLIPHVLKLATIDLPAGDLARLRAVVRPGAAAFLAPNHPEFMTDWLIDKEISRRVSALMAHWASYEVVNIHPIAQWIWLRANLIANAPGGRGRDYSIRWSRRGHGVLLHPEGAPSWRGDHVGPLVPGVVQMAWDTRRAIAAEGGDTPVYLVPLVWKLHYRGDVSRALEREIAHVERGLGLAGGRAAGAPLERRFADLQKAVLAQSLARHGEAASLAARDIADEEFFALQREHAERLLGALEARHGRTEGDLKRRLHGLRRAILAGTVAAPDAVRQDRRMLLEIERLHQFTREIYGGATLTQEQIAESLKALRLTLLTRGLRETIHGFLPVAVAARTVRVRVPEPIAIDDAPPIEQAEGPPLASLLATLHARMQGALDALNAEIAPLVDPWRRPNPFAAPAAD